MTGNFDNSLNLTRLILRRERITSTLWIVFTVLFCVPLAIAMSTGFDDAARMALTDTLNNPAIIAMMGPVYGADNFTPGAMYTVTMFLWTILAISVMNIMFMVRHTRTDEEYGRGEVVRSLPVGRLANLNAAMIAAVIVNIILGMFLGAGLAVFGGMELEGSMIYGCGVAVTGIFFAGLSAVFCQISSTASGAMGYSFMGLGVLYFIRAAGDTGTEALSLISPLGLILRSKPYVENNIAPLLGVFLMAALTSLIAYKLCSNRDLGQGLVSAKPGRVSAKPYLKSSGGLSYRLLRTLMIIWIITMYMLGASYGTIMADIENFVAESELYQQIIGMSQDFTIEQMFITMVNSMMSMLALVPILMALIKIRTEERDHRAEKILATPVSRMRYFSGFVAIAFAGSVLMQVFFAIGLYQVSVSVLPAGAAAEMGITLAFLLKASLAYLPALWAVLGFAVLIIGAFPKYANIIWGYFGALFFVTFAARVVDFFPVWLLNIFVFELIPQLPTESLSDSWANLIILTVIGVICTGAGFAAFGKRDVVW